MRQIADMGARALDDLAVGVDQRIGLARERRDLFGKAALQALGGAGADRREARRDALERRQAEAHLEHGGEQQHDREHAERDRDRAVEGLRLVVDFQRIARDRDQKAPVLAEIDGALDQAQALVLRARHVALARAVRAGRHILIFEMRQAGVPQRARGAHLGLRRFKASSPASTSPTAAARTAARRATGRTFRSPRARRRRRPAS